jgi:hypothetical protein
LQENKEHERRVQTKMLDSVLQEILTGKYRDADWFTGVVMRAKNADENEWKHGVLRERTDKYIEGVDLTRMFRDKLKPTATATSIKRGSPSRDSLESLE